MSSVLYGLKGRQDCMPVDNDSGDTIFDNDGKPEEEESSADLPLFVNDSVGVAAWANEDKNGDYYLSVKINLLDRSVNLFVPDEVKQSFNRFVEHVKEQEVR